MHAAQLGSKAGWTLMVASAGRTCVLCLCAPAAVTAERRHRAEARRALAPRKCLWSPTTNAGAWLESSSSGGGAITDLPLTAGPGGGTDTQLITACPAWPSLMQRCAHGALVEGGVGKVRLVRCAQAVAVGARRKTSGAAALERRFAHSASGVARRVRGTTKRRIDAHGAQPILLNAPHHHSDNIFGGPHPLNAPR
ncbi:MAG: hypothetical protein J3K34DRAFT_435375 [Monoraphidium minutum]|nr:MAG: hypothetical protein J3K34DRAFT_435375 [Monoraphidium minutum]